MKKSYTIALFGSYGGHNAGDDAILSSMINDISRLIPSVNFILLTNIPSFYKRLLNNDKVKMFPFSPLSKYEVPKRFRKIKSLRKLIQMRYFGIGFYGFQAINSIFKADAIVMTQNLFFDYKLLNPFFNCLFPWSVEIPFAKMLKKKVVAYNTGLGPINTNQGRNMLKRILSNCDFISLREHEGLDFIRENHIEVPVYLGADPVFNNEPTQKEEAVGLFKKEGIDFSKPILGININAYIDRWVITEGEGLTKKEFITMVSSAVKGIIDREGIQPVMICTNHGDLEIIKELRDTIDPDTVILDNYKYNHHQLMGMIGCMDFILGTRMHACVMAAAMGVPIVSISYAPKVKHFMRLIGIGDYSNDINKLSETDLKNNLLSGWKHRDVLKKEIEKRLPDLRKKASYPALILKKLLRDEPINSEEWVVE